MITFKIEDLIKFYDKKDPSIKGGDVSAITGIWGEDLVLALLQHYLDKVESKKSKILEEESGV